MICPTCEAPNDDTSDVCFKCGRALFSLTEGDVLSDRYEIRSLLGRGGMGMVYKAYDRELEETVALKVLRSDLAAAASAAKRFVSEIKLARRVSHENVCRIHEFGREAHLRYIVMEFIQGVDLRHALREAGVLPLSRAFDVSIQIAEALAAIHKVGIVHRDLKALNIMLDSRGNVRLMDFGIAKSLGPDTATSTTTTGQVVGTPEYMSPEQARGETIDRRSDIYAAGIVTFEVFTGDVPFRGDTPVGTLMMQINEPPPLQASTATRIPAALVPVLGRALAKSKDERYASAGELAEALRQAGTQACLTETPQSPLPRPASWPARPTPEVTTRQLSTPSPQPALPPRRPRRTRPRPPPTLVAIVLGTAGLSIGLYLYLNLMQSSEKPAADGIPTTTVPAAGDARSLQLTPTTPEQPSTSPPPLSPRQPMPSPTPRPPEARPTPAAPSTALPRSPTDGPPASPARTPPRPGPRTEPPPTPAAERAAAREGPSGGTQASGAEPATEASGLLQLGVRPYATVAVDGAAAGTTPMQPITLSAGVHTVELRHPDYRPFRRKITIRAGETTKLVVDLILDGIPK